MNPKRRKTQPFFTPRSISIYIMNPNTQPIVNEEQNTLSYQQLYYQKNKAIYLERSKEWGTKNKQKRNDIASRSWRKNLERNREKARERTKDYRRRNAEKVKQKSKQYIQENKQRVRLYHENYRKRRTKEDPLFAAKLKLRKCVNAAFERIKKNKPANTETLLGCSWEEAKAHFEKLFTEGMSWDNHGEWHIDHIRPVSDWKEDELHLMNHISNLQPLWAKDNYSKTDRLDWVLE